MTKKQILEFLIQTMDIQMVEEFKTTDHKDYIQKCIESKRWLYKQLNGSHDWIGALSCSDDYDKYILEK